ncbi:MAG: zinc ABC transporter substrate-binding protein [Campylobacterales bacterium]|nr:zinc ABC transporter substrate-binding protein [Campylobacterales bacterium]
MKQNGVLKKIFSFLLLATVAFGNVNAVVSILPQKTFVEKIGKDKVNVSLMVKPGNSPHSYEPKPSQMKDISNADIYFAIGIEFEHAWLERFQQQNKSMKMIHLDEGIEKIKMEKHSHHHDEEKSDSHHEHEEHHDHENHGFFSSILEFFSGNHDHDHDHGHHDHDEGGKDPHIWTSPKNVKILSTNIYRALAKRDPNNKDFYKKNLDSFLKEIDETDKKLKEILKNSKDSKFIVFHPAWGYFARDYNLIQVPVEVEGKEPKPKELAHLIEEAKEEKVDGIFTQPEFSDKSAKIIAKELGIKVVKTSPLNPKWSKNLLKLANAIARKSK